MEPLYILLNFGQKNVEITLQDSRVLKGYLYAPVSKDAVIKAWIVKSGENQYQIPHEEIVLINELNGSNLC
jgi:hypothetical protein